MKSFRSADQQKRRFEKLIRPSKKWSIVLQLLWLASFFICRQIFVQKLVEARLSVCNTLLCKRSWPDYLFWIWIGSRFNHYRCRIPGPGFGRQFNPKATDAVLVGFRCAIHSGDRCRFIVKFERIKYKVFRPQKESFITKVLDDNLFACVGLLATMDVRKVASKVKSSNKTSGKRCGDSQNKWDGSFLHNRPTVGG